MKDTTTEALLKAVEGRAKSVTAQQVALAKQELTQRGVHWCDRDCWCVPTVEYVPRG